MSGAWPSHCRRLVLEVNVAYAAFWALYVLIVVFAVTRVIAALFLQQTMKAASGDDEMMHARIICMPFVGSLLWFPG